jgi:hypothetical protein
MGEDIYMKPSDYFIFTVLSLALICCPGFLWRFKYGSIKDAEPKESSIVISRILGVVLLGGIIISLIFDIT